MGILESLGEYTILIAFTIVISIIVAGLYVIYKNVSGKTHRKKLLYEDFNVGKFNVILFRKISDKYHEIEKVKLDIIKGDKEGRTDTFRYKNKDFKTFDLNEIAYADKTHNYLAFDFDTGAQLTFKTKGMPEKITIDELDIYVNRHVIEDLVKGLEDLKPKGQYLLLVLGIVLGLAIGIIIGIYISPTINPPPVTPTPTPPIL